MPTRYLPEAVFAEGRLQRGRALLVSDEGVVLAGDDPGAVTVPLPGRLLLPGFVNGHSHAFQRVLRGRTEHLSAAHARDDFWSWREAMYEAASSFDPHQVYAVSKQAFLEMALAGVTTVGEFHYLQHQPDGTPYPDEHELSLQVIRAAREVGLRIVLLRVGYARAGFGVAPNPRQRRFLDPDVETLLRRAAELAARVEGDPLVTVGLAPHSVRAVPRAWLEAIAAGWRDRPLHMHVSEQPAELAACQAEHGKRPVELLGGLGLLHERFTAVHAIHLLPQEVQALGAAGATVCACPSTERNLGDGVVEADALLAAGAQLCLGSDSQAHIDLLQEAQQLEGHLRLVRLRRNVLTPGPTGHDALAARLLGALTVGGARSLGVKSGALAPGEPADFLSIELSHPSVLGGDAALLSRVICAGSSASVRDVFVAGRRIVTDGQHAQAESTRAAFLDVIRTLA